MGYLYMCGEGGVYSPAGVVRSSFRPICPAMNRGAGNGADARSPDIVREAIEIRVPEAAAMNRKTTEAPPPRAEPPPESMDLLSRIDTHRRGLTIVHLFAFIGTGIAALAMNEHVYIPRRSTGRFSATATFIQVLWVCWPLLASLHVSKKLLAGRTLAVWLFVAILAVATVVSSFMIDEVLARQVALYSTIQITMIEALVLTSAARCLDVLVRR
jgi:hypothetical protein